MTPQAPAGLRERDTSPAARTGGVEASPASLGPDTLRPGQSFATRGRTITEADVVSFAALTGDHHPQHVDAAWAQESRFGERVAHGALILSYALGLVSLDPVRVLALRRIRNVVFKRPARLGDTIRVEGRVDEARTLDDATDLIGVGLTVVNQDGATLVRAVLEVLWRRDVNGDVVPSEGRQGPAPAEEHPGPGSSGGLVLPL